MLPLCSRWENYGTEKQVNLSAVPEDEQEMDSGSRTSLTIFGPCHQHRCALAGRADATLLGLKWTLSKEHGWSPRPNSGSDSIFKAKIFLVIEFYH